MNWNYIYTGLIISFLTGTDIGQRIRDLLIRNFQLAVTQAELYAYRIRDQLGPLFRFERRMFIYLFLPLYGIVHVLNILPFEWCKSVARFILSLDAIIMLIIAVPGFLFISFVPTENLFDNHPRAKEIIKFVHGMLRPVNIMAFLMVAISVTLICSPLSLPFFFKVALIGLFMAVGLYGNIIGYKTNLPYTIILGLIVLFVGFMGISVTMEQFARKTVSTALQTRALNYMNNIFARSVPHLQEEVALAELQMYKCNKKTCVEMTDADKNDTKNSNIKIPKGTAMFVDRNDRDALSDKLRLVWVVEADNPTAKGGYVIEDFISTKELEVKNFIVNLRVGEYRDFWVNQATIPVHTYINPKPAPQAWWRIEVFDSDGETNSSDGVNAVYMVGTDDKPVYLFSNPDEDSWSGKYFKIRGIEGAVNGGDLKRMVKITRTR